MGRGKSTYKQRDLKAALKAAKQSGARVARVEVKPDGTICVVIGDPSPPTVPEVKTGANEKWRTKSRDHQK